jgi:hypothetical protein
MPTIFLKLGLRFYFVSYDCTEPPHVHISDDNKKVCKFWLRKNEVVLADNSGFTKKELTKLEKIVKENFLLITTTFNEFCKGYKK